MTQMRAAASIAALIVGWTLTGALYALATRRPWPALTTGSDLATWAQRLTDGKQMVTGFDILLKASFSLPKSRTVR